jgi:hypothetical protein
MGHDAGGDRTLRPPSDGIDLNAHGPLVIVAFVHLL